MKTSLKVLSYWNLNSGVNESLENIIGLKVLSYWNLNILEVSGTTSIGKLKVLSYWNLNWNKGVYGYMGANSLKYYHIGI